MTKDQILSASEKNLPRILGEVLQPEPSQHDTRRMDRAMANHKPPYCRKCDCKVPYSELCTVPDPIPLDDWPEAMKWRDWAVEKYGEDTYWASLCEVFKSSQNPTSNDLPKFQWFVYGICRFKPKHYLIAAALCVKGKND